MQTGYEHGGNIFAVARGLAVLPEEILDFSASINPLGPADGVKGAVTAAFDRVIHYPESDSPELRRALSDRHELPEDCICVANGSTELIYQIPRLVKGRRALLIAPTFSEYAKALQLGGWVTDYFILGDEERFELDLKQLEGKLAGGYDLLLLCNPGNPTGRLYPLEQVRQVISICMEAGTFFVLDEAFIDFCEAESAKHIAAKTPNMLLLRSLTKFYALPGLRLGWGVATPATIAILSELKGPWSVGSIAQAAALASLADHEYAERSIRLITGWRTELMEQLNNLQGCTSFQSAANFILLKLPSATADQVAATLLRHRILIRNCENFIGLDGHFIRMAVKTGGENRLLLDALNLKKAVK